ncbi:MAG: DUF4336 domain-containing protein [Clostridia bacterium]|nr:DUF4336 domain-containing protein [Clostridia bacterium]
MTGLMPVAENLWVAKKPFRRWGMPLESRMTVVRLHDGRLWLHSPVSPDPDLVGSVQRLGRVCDLIAPNRFHHLFAEDWRELFPDARLFAAPGLPRKQRRVDFDGVLGPRPQDSWSFDLDQQVLPGAPLLSEVLFFHHLSGTLIVTDLIANVGPESPWGLRLWMKLNGAYGRPASTRMVRTLVHRPALARTAMRDALGRWPVRRVICGHGALFDDDGGPRLRQALAWLL